MGQARPGPARRGERGLLLGCVAILGLTTAYPTARLLLQAAAQWQWAALAQGPGYAAVRNTLVMSLASVLTAGMLGSALAGAFHRYAFRGKPVLAALAYLPFALPPLVGVLSFYYLIGRDGVVPRALERVLGGAGYALEGPWAILLIHTYAFYVFFYATVSAALAVRDRAQVEAARTLGAGRVRVFLRVTLPGLRPALLGAALLTFMSSSASFSAPYFFGQDFPMLSVRIYEERMQFHHEAAVTLTVALACVSLLGLVLFRSYRRAAGVAVAKGAAPLERPRPAPRAVQAALWAVTAVLLTPHALILWFSVADHRAWHAELLPTRLTLANFAALVQDPRAFAPLRNSLWMSALAAAVALAVALPAGYLIGRRRAGGWLVSLLVMIPWALPGTVIAINLIVAFNTRWLPLYNTVWLLPLAYFVRGLPLLTRMAVAAIEPFDASLVESARSLGARPGYVFARVAAPLITPGVLAGTALVFATSLGEFVSSILLYLPANMPIAVKINMEWRGSVGAAFAYSVLLMVLAGATFLVSRRFATRQF